MIGLLVFIFGLIIGSFLNVLIYRLPRGISIAKGRSFCPQCRKKIAWHDNIPLFSFIVLKGRCRFCCSPISWRYPLVEIVTGVLTVLILNPSTSSGQVFKFEILNQFLNVQLLNFKTVSDLVLILLLVWGLIVIFFTDFKEQIIPDEILFPLSFLFLVFFLITNYQLLITNYLITAIASFLFFYLLYLITKGKGMGFGDVKLAFLMGLVLGFPKVIVAFYIAFLTGAFVGIILILAGKAKLKGKIAFGPFLILGFVTVLFYGEQINKLIQAFFGFYPH